MAMFIHFVMLAMLYSVLVFKLVILAYLSV